MKYFFSPNLTKNGLTCIDEIRNERDQRFFVVTCKHGHTKNMSPYYFHNNVGKCRKCISEGLEVCLGRQGPERKHIFKKGLKIGSWLLVAESQMAEKCTGKKVRAFQLVCENGHEKTTTPRHFYSCQTCRACVTSLLSIINDDDGMISKCVWGAIVDRCRNKGYETNLTPEYLDDIYKSQNGKCRFTGKDLIPKRTHSHTDATASLDRIDSNIGYLVGNVQWVHKDQNISKWSQSDETYINNCIDVAIHSGRVKLIEGDKGV